MTDEEKAAAKQAAEDEAARKAAEKTGDDTSDDKDGDKRIDWSQEKLEAFADEMYKKGANNSKDAKARAKLDEELEELRLFKTKIEKKATSGDQTDADVEFQEKLDTMKSEYETKFTDLSSKFDDEKTGRESDQENYRMEKLKSLVLDAAASAGALDPGDVFVLMKHNGFFKQDDDTGDWNILNPENGKIRIDVDEGGAPLSLRKGIKEYIDARPHTKRASGRTGSGQGGDSKGSDHDVPTSKNFDENNMSASDVYENREELLARIRSGGNVSVGGRHNQG